LTIETSTIPGTKLSVKLKFRWHDKVTTKTYFGIATFVVDHWSKATNNICTNPRSIVINFLEDALLGFGVSLYFAHRSTDREDKQDRGETEA
jgi:hypothetical protein